MKKRFLSILLLLFFILSTPMLSNEINQKKDELEQAKDTIEQSKDALKQTEAEKNQVQNEMSELDKKIINIEDEIIKVEKNLEEKEAQIEITKEELEEAIKIKDAQYEAMKTRLVHMYRNKKVGYMQVLFSSNSFLEMLTRMEYIKRIADHDNNLLTSYREKQAIVEQHKKTLEEEQVQIELLYEKQVSIRADLENTRKEKNRLLGVLNSQSSALYAKIEEMEELSKELEEQIKKLTAASQMKYTGGKFTWPVPGYYRISSEYNTREHPIFGNAEFHQGIDIPAPYGVPVVAAAEGKVIVSGWVRGFGYTIMIDHGSSIVSIYGHNSSLVANVGDYVQKGQQVARIGSTGYSTGNHCHFEVRVNGAHVSPWNYLNR
jgi:murein DD-endopeptidase MepM/ murein hydrolase activator NlpD